MSQVKAVLERESAPRPQEQHKSLRHRTLCCDERVAFAVTEVFIRINGYRITADSETIYAALMKLFEERTLDLEHLVSWLTDIVEKVSDAR